MNMNQDLIKGKWLEIKGEVQKMWGRLTDDEVEQTKGDVKAIAGLVQQKYGDNREKFDTQFSEIMDKFSDQKQKIVDNTKEHLKKN